MICIYKHIFVRSKNLIYSTPIQSDLSYADLSDLPNLSDL